MRVCDLKKRDLTDRGDELDAVAVVLCVGAVVLVLNFRVHEPIPDAQTLNFGC